MQLCATVNDMRPTFPSNFKLAMDLFYRAEDGQMDLEQFKRLNDRFPMVLYPAFRLQDNIQRATLGLQAWSDIARRVNAERSIAAKLAESGGIAIRSTLSSRMLQVVQKPFQRQLKPGVIAKRPSSAADVMKKVRSSNRASERNIPKSESKPNVLKEKDKTISA
jgi:hypothetical protein